MLNRIPGPARHPSERLRPLGPAVPGKSLKTGIGGLARPAAPGSSKRSRQQVGYLEFSEVAAPASPQADHLRIYAKDSGGTTKLYTKDSAGVETVLSLAPGATGASGALAVVSNTLVVYESFILACSDESTDITATTNKIKFRMPYAFTLTAVRASLSTAQSAGSIFTVDINEGGTTILSTKLTIDNTELTSTTAATAAVISDASLADDAEISVDVDQIGTTGARGLKVTLIGYRP